MYFEIFQNVQGNLTRVATVKITKEGFNKRNLAAIFTRYTGMTVDPYDLGFYAYNGDHYKVMFTIDGKDFALVAAVNH